MLFLIYVCVAARVLSILGLGWPTRLVPRMDGLAACLAGLLALLAGLLVGPPALPSLALASLG